MLSSAHETDLRSLKDAAILAVSRRAYAKAALLYQRIAVAEPSDPTWRQRAGEALRKAGHPVEASAQFTAAADAYRRGGFARQARALCALALVLDRHSPGAQLLREMLR